MNRNEPRRAPVNTSRSRVVDDAADKAYDAIEFGDVPAEEVISALREAADEVERAEVDA